MRGPKNEWREREQRKKHFSKLSTLKKYAKLAKKEGIVSDRVRLDNNKGENSDRTGHGPSKQNKKQVHSKYQHNPNTNTPMEEAKASKEEFFANREREKQVAMKKRKDMHKIMTQRTSRGQPVMAGRIKNILGKLMEETKTGNS